MRSFVNVATFLALALAACAALAACGRDASNDTGKPVVFVSIPPQAELVERLAGDRVEVRILLGQGASHEAYEPKPSQMASLAQAAVYVRAYVPFENQSWENIRAANPGMKVVSGFEHGETREAEDSQEHGHDHGGQDPHQWLDPRNMKLQAEAVAEALRTVDPEHADEYATKLTSVRADLEKLHADLRKTLEPVRGRTFWVYHPAWAYFADAYGLRQRAVEQGGLEPGAQSLASLIEEARKEKVRVIFVDPQTSSRNAEMIAREIGAELRELNPQARDYDANLRRSAEAILEALQ